MRDCDYSAYPSGCSYYEYCNFDCSCSGSSSASQAFLSEPNDLID